MTLKQFLDLLASLPGGKTHLVPYFEGAMIVWIDTIPDSRDNRLDAKKRRYFENLCGSLTHFQGWLEALYYTGQIDGKDFHAAMNFLGYTVQRLQKYALAK